MPITIPKRLALGVAVAAVGGTVLFGGTVAFAQADSTSNGSLVDKIASNFNLNESDVQKVFDQHRDELKAEHQADWLAKLDQAVKDGYLTEAQKTLIVEKRAELQATLEANRPEPGELADQTDEERKAHREQMQTQHQELKQWAEDNDIELRWFGGHGMIFNNGGDGPRHKMMFGERLDETSSRQEQ